MMKRQSGNGSWLGRLGSLLGVLLGGVVILGTSPDGDTTVTRVQEEHFAVGQSELRYTVRAAPLHAIEVRVTAGVALNWLNAPAVLPTYTQRNYVKPSELRLDCHETCGEEPCDSYCDALWISVTRDDVTQVQDFSLAVEATAYATDVHEIEIVRE